MADKRSNILILHTDQQRFDTIAALGAAHVVTPNMDRLVWGGVTFAHAYTSSPFCMPARHDLLTGTSARYHGYYQNLDRPVQDYGLATLPRLLTENGYQTIAVGKMHFYPEREHHGFDQMYLMEEIPSTWENDAYVQFLQEHGYGDVRCEHGVRPVVYPIPQVSRVPEEYHGAAWVATKTNELLCAERDRPFFIWASWVGPHPPFYAPKKYLDMYAGKTLPPCRLAPEEEENAVIIPETDVNHPWVQRFKEGYFARITLIDAHLGRILETLEKIGLAENTLVIFMSDHGEMLGDRRHFSKTVPYEGSSHIPLILRGPGIEPSTQVDTVVNTWDITTTILDAAEVAAPEGHPLIGDNLFDLDRDDGERIIISHLFEGPRRWIAAITARFKFVHHYHDGRQELYDLYADPWEQHNLVRKRTHEALVARLRRACVTFEQEYGQADAVSGGAFRDFTRVERGASYRSLPWPFNWRQFPRWMNGYSGADHEAILREMRDVIASAADPYIPSNEAWREQVLGAWEEIGGQRADMVAVFDEYTGLSESQTKGDTRE
jgi:arylsulfatase A-like enzyme